MQIRPLITAALLVTTFTPTFAQTAAAAGADPSAAHQAQVDADNIEAGAYVLTMDNISRVYQMDYELVQLGKSNPEMKAHLQKIDAASLGTIDQATAVRSQFPDVVAVLTKYNFAPRESVVAEIAIARTLLAAISIEQGEDRATLLPQMHLLPANLDFVNAHVSEIKALQAKYPTSSAAY